MDLDLLEAQWVLGKLRPEMLPSIAGDLMEMGYTGPAMLNLVSFHRPNRFELGTAFEDAMREIGRPPMTERRATLILAVRIAVDIVHGRMSPSEGAGRIANLEYRRYEELERMETLYAAFDEYSDRREFEAAVVDEAWRLIQDAPV